MSYEKISCRIAIQVCVGHFADGRERHRTFSLRHVRPEASLETVARIIRALIPVLEHPITKVRKVTKREVFSDGGATLIASSTQVDVVQVPTTEYPDVLLAITHDTAKSSFFAASPRYTAEPSSCAASSRHIAEPSSCASQKQKGFILGRAPPARSRPCTQRTPLPRKRIVKDLAGCIPSHMTITPTSSTLSASTP